MSNDKDDDQPSPTPPGAPDREPIKEPDKKEAPMGDPKTPKEKTPRVSNS